PGLEHGRGGLGVDRPPTCWVRRAIDPQPTKRLSGVANPDRQRLDAAEREEACGGGLQGGVRPLRPGEERARRAVESDAAGVHGDDAVGGGEAALEAVL